MVLQVRQETSEPPAATRRHVLNLARSSSPTALSVVAEPYLAERKGGKKEVKVTHFSSDAAKDRL